MDPDSLEEAITRYITYGVPIDGLMEGHLERLETLVDVWGSKTLVTRRVGEYILVYSRRAVQKAYRALVFEISSLIDGVLSNQPLDALEDRFPGLRLPPLIDTATEKLERSSGAVVVGVDRETGRVFVHTLPWFMAGFIGLVGEQVDEDIVRALMGFDYNPWEGEAGEGSIVRIQGDMAVRIVRYFDSDSEATRWVVRALMRYRLARFIYSAGLAAVEEASRILLEHAREADSLTKVAYIVPMALAHGISRSYGSLVEAPGASLIDISVGARTPERSVRPLNEPIVIEADIDVGRSFGRRVRECARREGRVCTGTEDTIVALRRLLDLTQSVNTNANLSDVYFYTSRYIIRVSGMDDVMATVASWVEEGLESLVEGILTSGAATDDSMRRLGLHMATAEWGLLGEMIQAEAGKVKELVEEAEVEVEVDDHRIATTGILIEDELVSRALTLSYIAEIANTIIEDAEDTMDPKKLLRMIRRRRGEWKSLLIALIKLLSLKTGTRYIVVLGDHVIEARHPEHGEASIGLPGPALVEVTSLNTDVAPAPGLFWGDVDDDFDVDDDLPPYNEDLDLEIF